MLAVLKEYYDDVREEGKAEARKEEREDSTLSMLNYLDKGDLLMCSELLKIQSI